MTTTTPDSRLTTTVEGRVATICLTWEGGRNALDRAMADAFCEAGAAVADLARDGSIGAIVLRAQGGVFSVGGDLGHFAGADDPAAEVAHVAGGVHAGIVSLTTAGVPVVTAVQGVAAGGGIGLALAGDIVVASERARFCMAYTAAGLTPDCGTSWQLPRRIGSARAADLTLTNRVLGADEALAWGLISRLVPSEDLESTTQSIAAQLAEGAPDAQRAALDLLRESENRSLREHLDLEAASISAAAGRVNGREGIAAFLAKRPPVFSS